MAEKYNTILRLAEETEKTVISSREEWFRFLNSAGRFCKYPFREQLLIHAQRPDAAACASIKVWDSMGCWINRGAKGIALIDTAAPRPKLKYVFDMADVTPEKHKNGHLPDLWSVRPEHERAVMEALEAVYGKTDARYPFKDRIAEMSLETVKGCYEDVAGKLGLHTFGSLLEVEEGRKLEVTVAAAMMESVMCAVTGACGLEHKPGDYSFSDIHKFNTHMTLCGFGNAVSSIVRQMVAEIGRAVREYERQKEEARDTQGRGEEKNSPQMQKSLAVTPEREYNALKRESGMQNNGGTEKNTDKERGAGHGTDIQTGRGLPDTGYRNGRTAGRGAEEVRPAAEEIPDGAQGGGVHRPAVPEHTDEPPVRDPGAGGGTDGPDRGADGGGHGSGRGAESAGPDAVGQKNEQHPARSGGNRLSRDDLHLNNNKDRDIQQDAGEKEVKGPDNAGSALSGPFFQNTEEPAGDTTYEQLDLFDMAVWQEGSGDALPTGNGIFSTAYKMPEDQIDEILRSGGGRDDSRKRIYAKYQQGKTPEEMAGFLRREYGSVGKGFLFGGKQVSIWFDENGMRAGRGMSARGYAAFSMDWQEIEQNIRAQVENGTYMGASEIYLVDEAERSRIAECLYFFFRDGMGGFPDGLGLTATNYPDSHAKIVELLATQEGTALMAGHMDAALRLLETGEKKLRARFGMPKEELRAELDNLMAPKLDFPAARSVDVRREDFITQDEIDACLQCGSGFENGKYRIYNFFKDSHGSAEAARFLKNEYGIGSRSSSLPGCDSGSEDYNGRGIKLSKGGTMGPYAQVLLKWNEVEKRIRKLIHEGRYLTPEEKEASAAYREKQAQKALENRQAGASRENRDGNGTAVSIDAPGMQEPGETGGGMAVLQGQAQHMETTLGTSGLETTPEALGLETLPEQQPGAQAEIISPQDDGAAPVPDRSPEGAGLSGLHMEKAENFRITDDALGTGGRKEKFRRNIEAVKTLEIIESGNRPATPYEQEILSQYVGWGGLADAFDESKDAWAGEYRELKALLSPEEYASARESTLNAYYTSPVVIRSIYSVLERMGFEKGSILEPSVGIGNFFGMLPESMRGSRLYGVELDGITGRIARQLYPDADIKITGFEKTSYPDDFFDIAVGNVPFGQYQVPDRKYDKHRFPVHEYFFAKALDQVRPGGIVAFVTSSWVMDKKSTETRKYLAQRAELLGAVRLPNSAFKDNAGTEVTADILFFQKLDRMAVKEPEWVNLSENRDGIAMNSYFVDHPEMVVGRMEMVSGPYGMESACLPDASRPFADQLMQAAGRISGQISAVEFESVEQAGAGIPADPDVKNYSYTVVEGSVYFRENSIMTPAGVPETTEKRIRGMVQIRDCTQELIRLQTDEFPDSAIKKKQAELNALYDNFTKTFGLLSSTGNKRAFSRDSSYCLLCSLEKLDDEGNFKGKADMFFKRTIKRAEPVTSVETAAEALAVSLSEKAGVDLEYMSALSGKDTAAVAEELSGVIFKNPVTEEWETADEYLSGNVRAKLETAEVYAENRPEYAVNAEALRRVQPKRLEASEIDVRIGATWLDAKYIDDFMRDVLKTPLSLLEQGRVCTQYSRSSGKWNIKGKNEDRGNSVSGMAYGTDRANAYRILEDSLNLKDVRIYDMVPDEDGRERRVLNKKETVLAGQKQEALREAFRSWVFEEPQRRRELCDKYNVLFNSTRPREYDGSHLKFPGMTPDIEMCPHQLNAVAHQLYGANTLLAHCVGAGKTFEMIAAAMEARRLGLSRKSLFVVPNHLTDQWAADFLRLYPGANILASTKRDFEPANRKKFCSRIATGEYDAVIIGHSQFEKIPLSAERQAMMIDRQIDEIEAAIMEAKAENGERYTIKQMEATKKTLYARLERLNDTARKDNVVTFEQLGVDRLFVDESHNYKNLFLYTKMRNVAGIAQSEAQKSSDMFAKCEYLDELTGGTGITFATGTPISNSMTEMYTNMRYLQQSALQRLGLGQFDAWASTFGETVTSVELAPEGTGYRAKTRFSKFYNLPELMSVFKECADIQTADMLKLPVPEAEYENVVLKPSEYQEDIVMSLAERAEKVRGNLVEPAEDNMLKITNDGRKLALDQRLVNDMLPDNENSKAAACVEKAFRIWESTQEQKSAQLIFCDLSTPKGDGRFNVYEDIRGRLVAKGVPEKEIAFIHSAGTDAKKAELFAKVRSGQVRFLLGSTQKMGAGTNVQDRLVALHHLDVPWRPADIEQQEGRILRQGNMNQKVFIFRYITENTFDSYSWQLIENKQKFISQIMTGKSPVRSCEDIDESVLSYAEVKALATGNPYIKEKMTLDVEVAKLKMMKANYSGQKYRMQDNITKHYPEKITVLERKIQTFSADIQAYAQNKPADRDIFSMKVGNAAYRSRKEAGAALVEMCRNVKSGFADTWVGEYQGFQLYAFREAFLDRCMVTVKGCAGHRVEASSDPFGIIQRLDNVLDAMPKELDGFRRDLDNVRMQLENAKEQVEKPFEKEQELLEKSARLAELNSLLNMDESGEEKPPVDVESQPDAETRAESAAGTEPDGHEGREALQESGPEDSAHGNYGHGPDTGERSLHVAEPGDVDGSRIGKAETRPSAAMPGLPESGKREPGTVLPERGRAAERTARDAGNPAQGAGGQKEPGYMEVRASVREKLAAIRERRAKEQKQAQKPEKEKRRDWAASL